VRRSGAASSNGNLADDGVRLDFYDALNRLVQVKRNSDDALGRRIRRVVSNGGLSGGRSGIYIDELIQQREF
jgi:hypothetical protein